MCVQQCSFQNRDKKKRNGCSRISLRYIFFHSSLYVYNANTNLIISYQTLYSISKRTSILFSALRGLRFNSIKKRMGIHIKNRTSEIIETKRFPFRVRLCALEKCIQIVYTLLLYSPPLFHFQPSVSFSHYYYYSYYLKRFYIDNLELSAGRCEE